MSVIVPGITGVASSPFVRHIIENRNGPYVIVRQYAGGGIIISYFVVILRA